MPVKARSVLSSKSRWIILSIATATLATPPLAASSPANAAAYTFTQIDVTGAILTTANGINDAGQIVGLLQQGVPQPANTVTSIPPVASPLSTRTGPPGRPLRDPPPLMPRDRLSELLLIF
jgi:hypothetical protein